MPFLYFFIFFLAKELKIKELLSISHEQTKYFQCKHMDSKFQNLDPHYK